MIRFLLKIWPALLPITLYLLWVFLVRKLIRKLQKKDFIEAKYEVIDEKNQKIKKISPFSLQNKHFVIILYLSLILAILTLLYAALTAKVITATAKEGVRVIQVE